MQITYYSWNWYDPNSNPTDIHSDLIIEFEKDFNAQTELTVTTNETILDGASNGYVTIITKKENISANDKVGRWDNGANLTGQATNFWRPLQDEGMVYFTTNVWNPFGNYREMTGWGSGLLTFGDNAGCVNYLKTGDWTGATNAYSTEWNVYWTGNFPSDVGLKVTWYSELPESLGNPNDLLVEVGVAGNYGSWDVTVVDTILPLSVISYIEYTAGYFSINSSQLQSIYSEKIGYKATGKMLLCLSLTDKNRKRLSQVQAVVFDFALAGSAFNPLYKPKLNIAESGGLSEDYYEITVRDNSKIYFRNSSGDDDDGYNNRNDSYQDIIDSTYDRGISFTSTYALDAGELSLLGSKIWNDDFVREIRAVNTAPIENICSVYKFPRQVGDVDTPLFVGNVDMRQDVGGTINSGKIAVGDVTLTHHYFNFIDYPPYSMNLLYLPFYGFVDLPSDQMYDKTYQLVYVIDYVTGIGKIVLEYESAPFLEWECRIGIEIPVSNQGMFYSELQKISPIAASITNPENAINSLTQAFTQITHPTTLGSSSPDCSSRTCTTAFILSIFPQWQLPANYYHTVGGPCNLTRKIGTLTGFTKCAPGIDLKGIEKLTEPEREELSSTFHSV